MAKTENEKSGISLTSLSKKAKKLSEEERKKYYAECIGIAKSAIAVKNAKEASRLLALSAKFTDGVPTEEANELLKAVDALYELASPEAKDTIPEEKRGRKPKPLSIEDIQNDTRSLIVKIREYEKIKRQNGKSIMRLHVAGQDLERMLRTHLID